MDSGKDEFQYRGKILFFETLKSEITINMIYAGTISSFCLAKHFFLQLRWTGLVVWLG